MPMKLSLNNENRCQRLRNPHKNAIKKNDLGIWMNRNGEGFFYSELLFVINFAISLFVIPSGNKDLINKSKDTQ